MILVTKGVIVLIVYYHTTKEGWKERRFSIQSMNIKDSEVKE